MTRRTVPCRDCGKPIIVPRYMTAEILAFCFRCLAVNPSHERLIKQCGIDDAYRRRARDHRRAARKEQR